MRTATMAKSLQADKPALSQDSPWEAERRRRKKEAHEITGAARRMIRASGRTVAQGDPEDLVYFDLLEAAIRDARAAAVAGLRDQGHSDAEIAEVIGVSKQAVQQRFPRS